MAIICTKKVPGPCENEAAEILLVRDPTWSQEWEQHPRCTAHPAAGDVAMIRRVSPMAETRIERLSDG